MNKDEMSRDINQTRSTRLGVPVSRSLDQARLEGTPPRRDPLTLPQDAGMVSTRAGVSLAAPTVPLARTRLTRGVLVGGTAVTNR